MPLMVTVPVSFSVPPAFTPWRMKNVPSVTMKLGSFVLHDRVAVDESDRHAEQQHDDDRRPDVPVLARRQQPEQQARAADHDAGREVELAADHEQRDRYGDDPVLRRLVGPLARDAEIGQPAARCAPSRRTGRTPRRRRTNAPMSGRATRRASRLTRARRSSGAGGCAVLRSSVGSFRAGGRRSPPTPLDC